MRLVSEERKMTVEVLKHLRDAERLMVYSELGYPSLFAYCVQGLGYSDAAACRRIETMRAIKDEPAVESKIASGALSLSAVSLARTSIRAFERETGEKLSPMTRSKVLHSVEGLSKRQAEKAVVQTLINASSEDGGGAVRATAEGPILGARAVRADGTEQLQLATQGAHAEAPIVSGKSAKGVRASGADHLQLTARVTRKLVTERHLFSGLTRVTMDLTPAELKVIDELRQISGEWKTTKDLFLSLAQKELTRLHRARCSGVQLRQGEAADSAQLRQGEEFCSEAEKQRSSEAEKQRSSGAQKTRASEAEKADRGGSVALRQGEKTGSALLRHEVIGPTDQLRQPRNKPASRLRQAEIRPTSQLRQAKVQSAHQQGPIRHAGKGRRNEASRYVPAQIRRETWAHARGQCEFVSRETGERCLAKSRLEIDHRTPFALGGTNALGNLRLLCRNHNVHAAVESFGHEKMGVSIPSLRP